MRLFILTGNLARFSVTLILFIQTANWVYKWVSNNLHRDTEEPTEEQQQQLELDCLYGKHVVARRVYILFVVVQSQSPNNNNNNTRRAPSQNDDKNTAHFQALD